MEQHGKKTIALRGGPLNGRHTTMPAGSTQVLLPANDVDEFSAWIVYRPTSELCADGVEIWAEYIESQWDDTGITDL